MIEWLQFQLPLILVQSYFGGGILKQNFFIPTRGPTTGCFLQFSKELLGYDQAEGSCWLHQLTRSQKHAKFGVARRGKASGIRGTLSEGLSVAEFFLPGKFNLLETSREVNDLITLNKVSYLAHCPVINPPPHDHHSEESLAGLVKFIVGSWVKLAGQASQSVESFGGCWPGPNKFCFEEWALRNFY